MSKWSIAAKPKDEQNKVKLTLRSPALHAKCVLVNSGRMETTVGIVYEKNITSGLCFPYINRGVCS